MTQLANSIRGLAASFDGVGSFTLSHEQCVETAALLRLAALEVEALENAANTGAAQPATGGPLAAEFGSIAIWLTHRTTADGGLRLTGGEFNILLVNLRALMARVIALEARPVTAEVIPFPQRKSAAHAHQGEPS